MSASVHKICTTFAYIDLSCRLHPQFQEPVTLIGFVLAHGKLTDWSFAEKTFVKQSMMLCAFEILLKIGRIGGGGKSYLAIWGKSYLAIWG